MKIRPFNKLVTTIVAAVVIVPALKAAPELRFDEREWDFGHIGLGFKVKHDFIVYNVGPETYHVDSFAVACDCSEVHLNDSTIAPGDTAHFELDFETTKFYGPTTKSLKVYTDYGALGEHIFYYQAIVGQWIKGFRPNPESFFFLPGHTAKKLVFRNDFMNGIELVGVYPFDTSFTVRTITKRADKGGQIELELAPRADLSAGSHESCLTLQFKIDSIEKPFRITVPVKTVHY